MIKHYITPIQFEPNFAYSDSREFMSRTTIYFITTVNLNNIEIENRNNKFILDQVQYSAVSISRELDSYYDIKQFKFRFDFNRCKIFWCKSKPIKEEKLQEFIKEKTNKPNFYILYDSIYD